MRASRNGARTLTSDDAVNAHNSSSIANVPDKYFAFENQLQSSQQMTTTSHYDHEHPSASDCLGQATGSRRDTQNRLWRTGRDSPGYPKTISHYAKY